MMSNKTVLSRLVFCLLFALSACDNGQAQRNHYLEEGRQAFKAGDKQKAGKAFADAIAIEPENYPALTKIAEELVKLGDLQSAANLYQTVVNKDDKAIEARIKLGQLYLSAGKITEAEQLIQQALALDADNEEAMLLLAGVLSAQNNTDAAFAKAEQVLKNKPGDARATLLLASLNAKIGKMDKAVGLLRQNLEADPKHVASQLLLANLYLQMRERDKAKESLAALIDMEPGELTHRQRLALFYVDGGQIDEAEQVLRKASQDLPAEEAAKLLLVEFLAAKRSPEVAIAELIPMIEQKPDQFLLRYKLADLQLMQRNDKEVEEILQETVKLAGQGGRAITARNKLAEFYLSDRQVEKARKLVQANLSEQPKNSDSLVINAQLALADNKIAEAIAGLRSVLIEQPNNINALKLLGTAHQLNNDSVLALENLQKILALNPKDEATRINVVDLLIQSGNRQAAEKQLNALFELNPDSKNGLEALAKIYLAQKQWQQARQVAQRIQTRYADDAAGFYLEALSFQAENKFDSSIPPLQTALRKQPRAIEPLSLLISAYLSLKQSEKALTTLNEIIKKQPEHFFAYNLMGGVYANGKKYDKAVEAYQKAVALQPQWPNAYRNLAAILQLQKNTKAAIEILNKGIDSSNNPSDLVNDLAKIHHQQGEHEQVIALYEKIHHDRPESLAAMNNLVAYIARYGKDEKYRREAKELLPALIESNNLNFMDSAAWFSYQQGDLEQARQTALKLDALNPEPAVIHYHLGMIYHKSGNQEAAKQHLQKAIDLKTEFDGLTEAKAVLKTMGNDKAQGK